jgi:hypothetical protein
LIAAFVLCAAAGSADAQAWTQSRGRWYASLTGSYLETEEEFNYRGAEQPIYAEDPARSDVVYRELASSLYLEYGVRERLTLVVASAYKNVRISETIQLVAGYPPQEAIRTNYGFSDLWLSGRAPLLRRRAVASVQCGVKVPLGYDPTPDNGGPPLGTGEVDGDFGAHVGAGLGRAYVSGGGSYRVRGGEFHDEWWLDAEAGGTMSRWFVKARLEGVRNSQDPPDLAGYTVETPVSPGVLNQVVVGDQDVTKFIGQIAFEIAQGWSVVGDVYHVLSGKNTISGTTFAVGIVSRRG